MFNTVDGLLSLACNLRQTNPHQRGASNVIALDTRFSTLISLDAGQLFDFAVKLLNLPAHATHFLCGFQRILRQVVSHDPVRAAGRHRNPEQFDLVDVRKSFDLDEVAIGKFIVFPRQRIDASVRRFPARIVDLTVIYQELESEVVYGLISEGGRKAVEIFVGEFDCRSQKHLTRGTSTMRKDKQEVALGLPEIGVSLDELVRRGARQVIQQVIELELAVLLEQYANVRTLSGKKAVVRNGYLPERDVLTAAGPVAVKYRRYATARGQA